MKLVSSFPLCFANAFGLRSSQASLSSLLGLLCCLVLVVGEVVLNKMLVFRFSKVLVSLWNLWVSFPLCFANAFGLRSSQASLSSLLGLLCCLVLVVGEVVLNKMLVFRFSKVLVLLKPSCLRVCSRGGLIAFPGWSPYVSQTFPCSGSVGSLIFSLCAKKGRNYQKQRDS